MELFSHWGPSDFAWAAFYVLVGVIVMDALVGVMVAAVILALTGGAY